MCFAILLSESAYRAVLKVKQQMEGIMKRTFFSFLSILFLSVSIPAFAMMGGGGMGSHMGGSGGWGGQGGTYRMRDDPNYNTPQPERSPGYD